MDFDGTLTSLTLIFERLRSYGLQVHKMPPIFRQSVPFLGHIVGSHGLEYDPCEDRGCQVVASARLPQKSVSVPGMCRVL